MERKTFIGYSLRILVACLLVVIVVLPSALRLCDSYELETLDLRFLARPPQKTTDVVAFIEIGEDTIKKIGRWPFDRSYHALLIKALAEAGARSIIFDVFFSEPAEHDRELGEAIRTAGNVYLPQVFDVARPATHAPYLTARGYIGKTLDTLAVFARGTGHINIIPDRDGKFRRIPLYVRYGQTLYPYISFLAVSDYLGIPRKEIKLLPGRYVLLGKDKKVPIGDQSFFNVNFSGKWGENYRHFSYVDVLQSYFSQVTGQRPTIDLTQFKNKICIVGLTASGTGDIHPTPFETLCPGMEMHAELINSVLTNQYIIRASPGINLAILLALLLLVALTTLRLRPAWGLVFLGGSVVAFIGIAVAVFDIWGVWIDLFYPVVVMALAYLSLTFYKYVAEWKGRLLIENELGIARTIQQSFLPKKLPVHAGVDIAAAMFTARQVGGDLYDFVECGEAKLGVMIGDVSGKGVPASLFMALVTGKFKSFAAHAATSPEAVLTELNTAILRESSSNLFVTMFYSIIDTAQRTVVYSNGGHLPLLVVTANGAFTFHDVSEGAPLGLIDGTYIAGTVSYMPGDVLVFYTDGITEAMNSRREMYGSDRLRVVVQAKRHLTAEGILNAIQQDVRSFEPQSRQHDDMTVIIVKMQPA